MQKSASKLLKGIFLLGFLGAFLLPMLTPLPTQAALVPCGNSADDLSTPNINESAPCTLCHLLIGINDIIKWIRNIMVAIGIAVIVAMGILYIVSTGNDSLMQTAKGGIKASLIGVAVILLAWLIVNFTLTLPIFSNTVVQTSWNTFTCDTASYAGRSTGLQPTPGFTSTTPVSGTTPTTPPVTGPPNPTTGVSLTLTNGTLAPGQNTTITVSGNINPALGPITFGITTGDVSFGATTTTAPFTATVSFVTSGTAQGPYTITAYQDDVNGVPQALATVTITLQGSGSGGGGGGGGSSCPAQNAQGIPYNHSLPTAPMDNWAAQDLYNYWISIPQQSDPLGGPTQWKDQVRFAMYSASFTNGGGGPTGFKGIADLNYPSFAGCVPNQPCTARANWINGHSTYNGGATFSTATGIGTYMNMSTAVVTVYPPSGIPCPAGTGGGGGGGGLPPAQDFCAQYGGAQETTIAWGDYARVLTGPWLTGKVVMQLVIPSPLPPSPNGSYTIASYTAMAEYQGSPFPRLATISRSKCDFRPVDPTGANGPYAASGGTMVTIDWMAGGPPLSLVPGETYYINFSNADPATGAPGDCPYNDPTTTPYGCNASYSTVWQH